MNVKCLFSFHGWEGCKCARCGRTRDGHHDWSKDCKKCSICGQRRDTNHDWNKDCEKCAVCDATRKDHHRVQGCQCTICGSEVHEWTALKKVGPMVMSCTCRRCGKEDRSVIIDPTDPDDLDAFIRVFGMR
jgi:hypothetical protein